MKKIQLPTSNAQKNHSLNQAGFTMIELLLYMGIFSILLVVLLQIFSAILSVHAESESSSSIDQEMSYVLNRLTYDIHRASSVDAPTEHSLQLLINGSSVTYAVSGDTLQLSDSTGSNSITSDDVTPEVTFQVLGNSDADAKKAATITLTLTSRILRDGGRAVSDTYTTTVQTR